MFDVKRSQYFTLIILFQNNLFQAQFCTAWRVQYYQYKSVYFRVVCVSTYVIAHKQYTALVIVDWMYGVGCDVIIYGCCHNSHIFCHWKIINSVFYCTTLNAQSDTFLAKYCGNKTVLIASNLTVLYSYENVLFQTLVYWISNNNELLQEIDLGW